MADVDPDGAGLASGLITTAHEIGAAFGVAIFSAVALGAGAAIGDAAGSWTATETVPWLPRSSPERGSDRPRRGARVPAGLPNRLDVGGGPSY